MPRYAPQARWQVTITSPNGMATLFNTPEESSDEAPSMQGYTEHRFATTPPMSSYLVAIVVGELDSLKADLRPGDPSTPLQVWGRRGQQASLAVALATAQAAIAGARHVVP
jgi:aminopeptidase N